MIPLPPSSVGMVQSSSDNRRPILAEEQPHHPGEPDSSKPWCPTCELHTEYHLKSRGSKTVTFYTCDVCGGNTWKPTLPIPLLIVSLLFILFIFFMGFYAVIEMNDEEGFIMFPFGVFAGYVLYKNYKSNAKHWRAFHKWAKAQRQQAKRN